MPSLEQILNNTGVFLQLVDQPLVYRALIAGAYISVLCAVLGVFLSLKKLSLVGDGLSHTAFTGVALGLYFDLNPTITAIITGSLIGALFAIISQKKALNNDSLFGVVIAFSLALGMLIISKTHTHTGSVYQYLFGNIFSISHDELVFGGVVTGAILAIFFLFRKQLIFSTIDEQAAKIAGVSTLLMNLILFISLGITVVIAQRLVGSLLISSLLIVPAAIAFLGAKDINSAFIASICRAFFLSTFGIILAIILDTPAGATIAILCTFVFGVSYLLKSRA